MQGRSKTRSVRRKSFGREATAGVHNKGCIFFCEGDAHRSLGTHCASMRSYISRVYFGATVEHRIEFPARHSYVKQIMRLTSADRGGADLQPIRTDFRTRADVRKTAHVGTQVHKFRFTLNPNEQCKPKCVHVHRPVKHTLAGDRFKLVSNVATRTVMSHM